MSLVQANLRELANYEIALAKFKVDVNTYCNDLETGIGSCSKYMLDATSQKALQKGRQVAQETRAILNDVERLLEMVRMMIQYEQQGTNYELY